MFTFWPHCVIVRKTLNHIGNYLKMRTVFKGSQPPDIPNNNISFITKYSHKQVYLALQLNILVYQYVKIRTKIFKHEVSTLSM